MELTPLRFTCSTELERSAPAESRELCQKSWQLTGGTLGVDSFNLLKASFFLDSNLFIYFNQFSKKHCIMYFLNYIILISIK